MIKWDTLDRATLVSFAAKQMSGRKFVSTHVGSGYQEADRLVRKYGVEYSQRLARKSLRRRGIDIRLGNV